MYIEEAYGTLERSPQLFPTRVTWVMKRRFVSVERQQKFLDRCKDRRYMNRLKQELRDEFTKSPALCEILRVNGSLDFLNQMMDFIRSEISRKLVYLYQGSELRKQKLAAEAKAAELERKLEKDRIQHDIDAGNLMALRVMIESMIGMYQEAHPEDNLKVIDQFYVGGFLLKRTAFPENASLNARVKLMGNRLGGCINKAHEDIIARRLKEMGLDPKDFLEDYDDEKDDGDDD